MSEEKAVQDRYAPDDICFGCGPANPEGLRIKSYRDADADGDGLRCEFRPHKRHQAYPGIVNGGIIGTLLDCHGNWTGAVALMEAMGRDTTPRTVTSYFSVRLLKPTPSDAVLTVRARTVRIEERKAHVEMWIEADGVRTAEGDGLFVALKEGHQLFAKRR